MSRESQDFVPSPILEAQSEHQSKLLAMKAETSSMRKLQELLTNAHAENRKLKAEQQQRRESSSSDLQDEMSKVMAELAGMRSEGESMHSENAELRQEVKSKARELERLMQKYKDLEAVLDKTLADNRELRKKNELADLINAQKQKGSSDAEVKVDANETSSRKEDNLEDANLPSALPREKDRLVKGTIGSNDLHLERSDYVTHAFSKTTVKHTDSNSSSVHVKSDDDREGSSENRRVSINDRARTASDDIMAGSAMQSDKASDSEHGLAKSKDSMALPVSGNFGIDHDSDRTRDVEGHDAQTAHQSSPEAVVDWKYLAMTPEPENEMRSIAQYISSNQDTGTASESETESRASDLFTSSTVSSPVGRFRSAQERRPSLGGLIVEKAQESPPLAEHQQEKDDTLIDESYLETSHDYITADENSFSRTASPIKLDHRFGAPSSSGASGEETTRNKNLTPYYTPMVQRNKHNFSSVTTSLQSLKDISRKAREEIESETVNGVSDARNGVSRKDPYMGSLEDERKWIQEELGRIRLDNNIPGDRYPDIGAGKDGDSGFESRMYTSARGRYVPRWRKFQFRSKQKSPEAMQQSSHHSSNPYLHSLETAGNSPTTALGVGRMNLERTTAGVRRSSDSHVGGQYPLLGSTVYPTMSKLSYTSSSTRSNSEDLSDEYQPLPDELREPRRLAERSPGKNPDHAASSQISRRVQESRSPTAPVSRTNGVHVISSLSRQDTHIPDSQGRKSDMPLKNFGAAPLSPESRITHRTDFGPSSPTGTDDICASDSVSMISAAGSVKPHSKQVTFGKPQRTMIAPVPLERKSLHTNQAHSQQSEPRVGNSDGSIMTAPVPAERKSLQTNPSHSKPAVPSVDKNGGSGGIFNLTHKTH